MLAKDLLPYGFKGDCDDFVLEKLSDLLLLSESKRVDKLLKDFREQRYHMAIVVDEFGGVSGLVTIEDILEQIVGDIEDEYEEEEKFKYIFATNLKRIFSVSALTSIDDFNDYFGANFSSEEIDTIGGHNDGVWTFAR